MGAVTGTRGNLRYCAFQQVRLGAMWGFVKTHIDHIEVDRRADDWRARCGQMQSNPDDLRVIDREVSAARLRLVTEGGAIFRQWQEDNASRGTSEAGEK